MKLFYTDPPPDYEDYRKDPPLHLVNTRERGAMIYVTCYVL